MGLRSLGSFLFSFQGSRTRLCEASGCRSLPSGPGLLFLITFLSVCSLSFQLSSLYTYSCTQASSPAWQDWRRTPETLYPWAFQETRCGFNTYMNFFDFFPSFYRLDSTFSPFLPHFPLPRFASQITTFFRFFCRESPRTENLFFLPS